MVTLVPRDITNYGSALAEGLIGVGFRRPIAKRFTVVYAGGFDFLYETQVIAALRMNWLKDEQRI
jgi:hypothetical protein